MNPTDFIAKHIAAQLVVEGYPEQVALGGGWSALTTIAECRRQAVKVGRMTIALPVPASGPSDKQQAQNARQRKSRIREESPHPACSDFVTSFETNLSRKDFMTKHSRNLSVSASGVMQPVWKFQQYFTRVSA